MLICLSSYLPVVSFKLYRSFQEMKLRQMKGELFCVFWNSRFMIAVSLSPHSSVFCCQQRGKNYKFQKLHYPLEQGYGLKKMGLASSENKCSRLHVLRRTTSGIWWVLGVN